MKGFRAKSAPNHYYLVHSLEFTINASPDTVIVIESYRKKRHRAVYEISGLISEKECVEIEEITLQLYRIVKERFDGEFQSS